MNKKGIPEFSDGKIYVFDEYENEFKQILISSVSVMVDYPQERLETIELLNVDLFDINKNLIYHDNEIINHTVYYNKKEIINDLVDKYKIDPALIEIIN